MSIPVDRPITLKEFIKALNKIEARYGGDLEVYVAVDSEDLENHLVTQLPIAGWTDTTNSHVKVYTNKKGLIKYDEDYRGSKDIKRVVSIVDFDVWRDIKYAKNINK